MLVVGILIGIAIGVPLGIVGTLVFLASWDTGPYERPDLDGER